MPVRKIPNYRGRRHTIGKYPSVKLNRMVAFESQIELDFIITLEYEKDVSWFEEQPVVTDFQIGGKTHHYTPDFLYTDGGQHILADCKPAKFAALAENRVKFAAATQWCEGRGWEFRVITDTELRSGFRLENIKALANHARISVNPHLRTEILDTLSTTGETTIDQLLQSIQGSGNDNELMPAVFNLAYYHLLEINIDDEPLSRNSIVSLPDVGRRNI